MPFGCEEDAKEFMLCSRVKSLPSGTIDKVGELGVNEARSVVGFNFNSGAKVEVLGGLGFARRDVTPRPGRRGSFEHVSGDSSWISAIAWLGDLLACPSICGDRDIRTQF